MPDEKPFLVIVTGQSGAGRTVCINALEDNGFYCMDNLPVEMIESALHFITHSKQYNRFALGLIFTSKESLNQLNKLKSEVSAQVDCSLLYLTCSEQALEVRFNTTRRKHPFIDQSGNIMSAIRREKAFLEGLNDIADVTLDTSDWSPHFLANVIETQYTGKTLERKLFVTITSFGFRFGQPHSTDSLVDVRFLNNPYYVQELKYKTGLEEPVKKYILDDPRTEILLNHLAALYSFMLPEYFKERKHYFKIAIGCTGGKHRSVFIAEKLAERLNEKHLEHIYLSVNHRDVLN